MRENGSLGKPAALLLLLVIIAPLLAGCVIKGDDKPPAQPGTGPADNPVKPKVDFAKMPRFNSYAELEAAFAQSGGQRNYGIADIAIGIATLPLAMTANSVSAPMMEKSPDSAGLGGSSDFSRTNVQVGGVDEADIVKSDGRYIYTFSKNRLIIVDAYPAESGKIVSETALDGLSPIEMFVSGDRLLLFATSNGGGYYGGAQPGTLQKNYGNYYGGTTVARLYDISGRENPKQEKELEFRGSYLTSRLIGNNAYFVINSYPNYGPCGIYGCGGFTGAVADENNIIPMMKEDGAEKRVADVQEIGYLPPMPIQSFVTIASLNLDSKQLEKETIAGSAESVFASENSIYLAATAYLPREVQPMQDVNGSVAEAIGKAGQATVQKIIGAPQRAIYGDYEKTVVNKFGLDAGKIGFVAQGIVPGHVLNQFSMDEYGGNFRIATTQGQVSRMGSQTSNNLYVLDGKMGTIGTLEGLAPGEKIYSARFMGKKAYMVTFKKVDPLFVIDVSNPREPKVLGKLKIPGYSDYLHPIDENHIIGVGKDTVESGYGNFAWYQGMKMAIFDVSDVANPLEMHKIVIGDRGTDSFALQNHKAFLYDNEKQLLVLPIELSLIPEEQKRQYEERANAQNSQAGQGTAPNAKLGQGQVAPQKMISSPLYGEPVFQGAFVYKVSLENGFEERGRITHLTAEDELKRGYYYGNEYVVKRALYIGDTLYTLSDRMLRANSLSTLEPIREFAFG